MVTELPSSVIEPDVASASASITRSSESLPTHLARAVAFAISQPEEMDVSEIVFRGTREAF
jgi:NADP-dependent 3-hydroxy acid dehydrogenase YdfG